MTDVTAVAVQTRQDVAVRMGFETAGGFELLQRGAKVFAASSMVPAIYRNDVPNCIVALEIATRLGASPLLVMQNLYIVNGNPGWSAKFLIASVNTCGRFSAMRFTFTGEPGTDTYGCRAWAVERSTNERLAGITVDWRMVKAEGWDKKPGSKWKTMPDQMFIYRAASFWQRAYAPEISMGLHTVEELEDIGDLESDGSVTLRGETRPRAGSRTVSLGDLTGTTPVDVSGAQEVEPPSPAPTATPPAAEPPQTTTEEPPVAGFTYAQILDSLQKSKTLDELDDIIRLADGLPDGQEKELREKYRELREKFV